MSPTPSPQDREHRPVRGARSCTLCRQMKARCNATEMYPDACSRCTHLGKAACIIEPSFRRVNKRARIAEIQNELEELKNTVKQQSGSSNSRESSEYSDSQGPFLPPGAAQITFSPRPSPFPSPYSREEDPFRTVGITGRIDSQSEDDLFMTFFTKFHPTLAIVDYTLTPAHAFAICPLLYYTILLLGTLATPNHSLTWSLTNTVLTAAPQQSLSPNKSVHLVQAFLLLATWPQGVRHDTSINDQAWMYVGVATHMAQCLGLHRSFLCTEYNSQVDDNEDTRREWVRTWVGCFIVGQFLSTALGVNPIIAEDFTIQNASALLSPTSSSTYDPALSFLLDKLKMARVGARITGLLSSSPNSSSGLAEVGDNLAIFRILQGDVQEVEASLLNADEARGLSFLWLKTQLYSYALHDGMIPPSARTEFILRGFEASYYFLETFATTVERTPIRLLPALHPFSAACSWIFVLKALYSRYRMYLDVATTEKLLANIQRVMVSKSSMRGDFCSSVGMYMDTLLKDAKVREQNPGEPFINIRSRMTAGLYFDGLARLEQIKKSNNFSGADVKVSGSPTSSSLSDLSSPLLASDMSTPPTEQISSFPPETSSFGEYCQSLENTFGPDKSNFDMGWLADSFLLGESGVAPAELAGYSVAPGLLTVQ